MPTNRTAVWAAVALLFALSGPRASHALFGLRGEKKQEAEQGQAAAPGAAAASGEQKAAEDALFAKLEKDAEKIKDDLAVRVAMDRSQYRPGDAVVVAVELTNMTDKPLPARWPNFDSLQFFFGSTDKKVPFRRSPVYSKDEIPLQFSMKELESGGKWRRNFLLTRLTESPGEFVLTVGYTPSAPRLPGVDPKDQKSEKAAPRMSWSNVVLYTVGGDRALHRDSKGVLLKGDAVALAKQRLARPVADVKTELIWDEYGFLEWWVCLTVAPETLTASEPPKHACFVNAYTGRVRPEEAPTTLTYLQQKKVGEPRVTQRHPEQAASQPFAEPGLTGPEGSAFEGLPILVRPAPALPGSTPAAGAAMTPVPAQAVGAPAAPAAASGGPTSAAEGSAGGPGRSEGKNR
ncbi:MAG: hypothetical protein NTW86_20120 [Candidatus Sumerlaeota bacterium]|nr:hypothetical protein [Candidatus Sumerlaeota bacterium]